jgi:hypothetical protein
MKTTKIFFATFTLGVLLTACWGSKHATSQKQSSGKADTTAITNVVRKDTATVDSLTWYAGPLPVFESHEAYFEYIKRQTNLIRYKPLTDGPEPVYIKNKNGNIEETLDVQRSSFYIPLNFNTLPVIVQNIMPTCNFYILKGVDANGVIYGDGVICRQNNTNYSLPRDINLVLNNDTNVSIEKKVECILSLIKGLGSKYQINSLQKKKIKYGLYYTDFEIEYSIDGTKYVGYIVLNYDNEIYGFYYKDDISSTYLELNLNVINNGYKVK